MIQNPQVVKFVNERIRPMCDRVAGMYGIGQQLLADVEAKGIDELLGADDSELIDDGAPADGRTPLTVGDVRAVLAALTGFHNQFEANSKALYTVFGKPAVNPR